MSASDFKRPKRIKDPDALRRFHLTHIGEPCDACELRPGIHAHHRIFRSQGGDDSDSNLSWLCAACHHEAHGIRDIFHE